MPRRPQVLVWEVVGISRIERREARSERYENWYVYRCYTASGRLVFEAGDMHETIFKYRYYFERGEL